MRVWFHLQPEKMWVWLNCHFSWLIVLYWHLLLSEYLTVPQQCSVLICLFLDRLFLSVCSKCFQLYWSLKQNSIGTFKSERPFFQIYIFLLVGCMLCFGQSSFFRFNHPEEALRMKSLLPGGLNMPRTQPAGKHDNTWRLRLILAVLIRTTGSAHWFSCWFLWTIKIQGANT